MMNGREKTPEKPISVVMNDFKNALYSICQNSALPAYLMEPIVKNLHNDVLLVAKRIIENEKMQYEEEAKASRKDVEN